MPAVGPPITINSCMREPFKACVCGACCNDANENVGCLDGLCGETSAENKGKQMAHLEAQLKKKLTDKAYAKFEEKLAAAPQKFNAGSAPIDSQPVK